MEVPILELKKSFYIYLFIYLFIYLSIYLFIYLFIYFELFVFISFIVKTVFLHLL